MKKILALLFVLVSVSSGQINVSPDAMTVTEIDLSTVSDSVLLFTMTRGQILEGLWIVVDSTITGTDGDSLKIGTSGERPLKPFRFADFPYDSILQGQTKALSHYEYRQYSNGAKFTYEGDGGDVITVVCTDAETYYPMIGLSVFPYNDFESTGFGALKVRPYRDGWYAAYIGMSFMSSKANVTAHGELFRNGSGYDYLAFERTISSAAQTGNASASGKIYLAEGDSVRFMLKSNTTSTTYSIEHAQMTFDRSQDHVPYVAATNEAVYLYTTASGGRIRIYAQVRTLY